MDADPRPHGPFTDALDPSDIAAFAAATGDQTASVRHGDAVPAAFPMIPVFAAREAARADLPDAIWPHVRGGVSGDWSAHHFEIDAAKAAGFAFVFAHGLCTTAICAHRLLGLLGIDDAGVVQRIAVRFAAPTPLGAELTVNAAAIAEHSFAFEATCNATTTITNGRLELRQ